MKKTKKKCPHLSKHLTKMGDAQLGRANHWNRVKTRREAIGTLKRRNPGIQGQQYNRVDESTLTELWSTQINLAVQLI